MFPTYCNPKLGTFQDANVRASPVCQLLYCTTVLFKVHCTVRLKMVIFCAVFLRMYCVKTIISLSQYNPIKLIVLAGDLGCLCWTCEQAGFRNVLLEMNLFVFRGLTEQWLAQLRCTRALRAKACASILCLSTTAPQSPHLSDEEMGPHLPKVTQWGVGSMGG